MALRTICTCDPPVCLALATTRVGVTYWNAISSGGYAAINDFSDRGYETIVGVPDLAKCDSGPSSRMGCPLPCLRRSTLIKG